MLEDRDIDILAYNVETVLAEKIETMLVRSTLNTRTRDFYDMLALANMGADIDYAILAEAVAATAKTRGHDVALADSNGFPHNAPKHNSIAGQKWCVREIGAPLFRIRKRSCRLPRKASWRQRLANVRVPTLRRCDRTHNFLFRIRENAERKAVP
ncbi:nucleotidyl transferase AbiEii/AbiGii toxin family protein [Xiamenia xianingshaonis]|nr:nucleotidyl transferase AbiEii/AbiGii toxin family protein [Xiamenia xianingshaonis]